MSAGLPQMVAAGALTGTGVALVVAGLRPPRRPLADVLDSLSLPAPAPVSRRRRLDLALATPMARLGLPRPRTVKDLAICDRDVAEYLAQQVVIAVAAMVGFGLLPVLWGLGGQLPLWLALLGTAVTVRHMTARLHTAAQARREQMRETLSTLLDLIGGSLAGGAGIEQAVDETIGELDGWAAMRIRRELAAAALTRGRARIPVGTALRTLGAQIGVDELVELATAVEQAGAGAPVAESMATVAQTLRERITAEAERQAHAKSAQMAVPIMLFGLGYLILLIFAALGTISAGLTQ